MAAAIPLDSIEPVPTRSPKQTRIALVTGGTGGIGTAVCKRLAGDGNQVIATHLAVEREAAEEWQTRWASQGYSFGLVECDVASFESCSRMAREVEAGHGPVEILINCAGITRDKTLGKMEPEQWKAVLDTNLDSMFNVTRNLIDRMLGRRYGRIVSISSVNGRRGQFGQTNYSASKAGIYGFTRALAREVADQGITVNTVSPGYVNTSMVQAIPAQIRDSIVSQIPVGRLARPDEIARAVAFLASEESGYITGTDIAVNGGLFTV